MFVEMLYYNSESLNFLVCNFFLVSFFNQFYCMMKSMKVCCMIDVLLTFFFSVSIFKNKSKMKRIEMISFEIVIP